MGKIFTCLALVLVCGSAMADKSQIQAYMLSSGIDDIEEAYLEFAFDASTGNEQHLWLSRQFAACNAAAWTLARLASPSAEEAKNHYLHQVGNGALFTGRVINSWAGYKEEMYTSRLDALLSYWKSTNVLSGDGEMEGSFEAALKSCADLQKLQAAVVEYYRHKVYKAEPKTDATP